MKSSLLSHEELELKEFLRMHGLAQFLKPLLSAGVTNIYHVQNSSEVFLTNEVEMKPFHRQKLRRALCARERHKSDGQSRFCISSPVMKEYGGRKGEMREQKWISFVIMITFLCWSTAYMIASGRISLSITERFEFIDGGGIRAAPQSSH